MEQLPKSRLYGAELALPERGEHAQEQVRNGLRSAVRAEPVAVLLVGDHGPGDRVSGQFGACISAITTDDSTLETPGAVGAAVALRATLPDVTALTEAECGVLTEWLDRIAAQAR
ncbi:MAG TPA: hypothetical protein VLL08_21995 [Kineosporiaceae bacterium]|nr:hypothetical protein [Kineosporiaceae bacterium]